MAKLIICIMLVSGLNRRTRTLARFSFVCHRHILLLRNKAASTFWSGISQVEPTSEMRQDVDLLKDNTTKMILLIRLKQFNHTVGSVFIVLMFI